MNLFFYIACVLCVLYCGLYGAYSIADRHISQGISALVMTALGAGAVALLMIVA